MQSKKQIAVTISFSKRNLDVYKFLLDQKQDEYFNQNDYVCKAIRFYEEHKNDKAPLSIENIQSLIDQSLLEFKRNIIKEISIDEEVQEEIKGLDYETIEIDLSDKFEDD